MQTNQDHTPKTVGNATVVNPKTSAGCVPPKVAFDSNPATVPAAANPKGDGTGR